MHTSPNLVIFEFACSRILSCRWILWGGKAQIDSRKPSAARVEYEMPNKTKAEVVVGNEEYPRSECDDLGGWERGGEKPPPLIVRKAEKRSARDTKASDGSMRHTRSTKNKTSKAEILSQDFTLISVRSLLWCLYCYLALLYATHSHSKITSRWETCARTHEHRPKIYIDHNRDKREQQKRRIFLLIFISMWGDLITVK